MTKEQILTWLRQNKPYLNIRAIGKAAGVSSLANIVDERTDGRGYKATLSDKHLPKLTAFIENIKPPA